MKKNLKTGSETYTIEIANIGQYRTKGANVFYALDALKRRLQLNSSSMIIVSATLIKSQNLKFDVTELLKT